MKLFKNIPLIPSIRPKCGADKKGFLNDVYTKGTREKKLQLDAPQSGRSMIEMLGVLAIIGVLSIGGIAGYSKAMFKYKMNKSLDMFSTAIAKVVELKSTGVSKISGHRDMITYGIFPDCNYELSEEEEADGETTTSCILPAFNVYIDIDKITKYHLGNSISITFNSDHLNSCINFLTSGVHTIIPDDWGKNIHVYTTQVFGSYTTRDGDVTINTIELDRINKACKQYCNGSSKCYIEFNI